MFSEGLPEDVEEEIFRHLDTPSLLTTGELSRGWRERKAWCTPEWIDEV